VSNDLNKLEPSDIADLYKAAFRTIGPKIVMPPIEVIFYPYIGINHTIRIRGGKALVRIAEICRDMPLEAHRELANILVSKILGKRTRKIESEAYQNYIRSAEVRGRATDNKRKRGRKIVTTSGGRNYDLEEIFDDLNVKYFSPRLPKPVLTWSARKTFRILGHHDSTHDTIVISRSLDENDVPRYVVEYVVYHEMLHIAHPTVHHNGRRYNHTPVFRRDEQRFPQFDIAEKWIARNVRKMKKNAKR